MHVVLFMNHPSFVFLICSGCTGGSISCPAQQLGMSNVTWLRNRRHSFQIHHRNHPSPYRTVSQVACFHRQHRYTIPIHILLNLLFYSFSGPIRDFILQLPIKRQSYIIVPIPGYIKIANLSFMKLNFYRNSYLVVVPNYFPISHISFIIHLILPHRYKSIY